MNAIEKFYLGDSVKITELRSSGVMFLHNIFFKARRKVMRGLEEHLVHDKDNHDFISSVYLYKLEDADKHVLYIRFEPDWVFIGSEVMFGAW